MDKEFLDDGSPINPEGMNWIDLGLGNFLRSLAEPSNQMWRNLPFATNIKYLTSAELMALAAENDGKHKVPTLRNVAKGFGKEFPKAYMHNGVFKSLKEVVHFYNTRDVEDWPAPEVPQNVNTDELGDLGLTNAEEDAIVAFMETLTDGFKVKKNVK
jgi:cytochrome c peroxidase